MVRGLRAGSAVAGAGRLAVGGAGQRDHAAADAGQPGPARLPGLAGTVAHARRAGGRSAGRGRAAVGPPRLSPARPAPARDRHDRDHAAWRPDPLHPRRAARAARGSAPTPPPPWPYSPSAAGTPSSTRTSAACLPGWGPAASSPGRSRRRRSTGSPSRCCREDAAIAARWSVAVMELGALTCTAASPRCDDCPVATRVRLARRLAGRGGDQAGRPALRRHGPPVPGPPARRAARFDRIR